MLRLALVVALALAWVRPASAYDVARPMGLYASGSGAALVLLDSRLEVTVRGPIVEVVAVQRFRNPMARATEATYIFPLPADAAVSAMAIQVGARSIRAAIEPRESAQRRYEAAVAAGVGGALLEQERPDVFTQTVAAIPPHGVVEVTLRYDTLARFDAGGWQLVLPMVVAPRYVPGTASGRGTTGSGQSPDTDRAPDASRITPSGAPGAGGQTAVAIHFVDPPAELSSPSHELGGTRSDATLVDPHSDHDAIVRWRAAAPSAGWIERDGDGGYAAVVLEAPAAPARKAPIRVILAIDRAATTRGDADAIARPLVRALFGRLDAADRVRLIGSENFMWSAPGQAQRLIEAASGRAVPVFDLSRVLRDARPEGAAIVLVSDGLVADDRAAIAAARGLGVPIHVVGIGPAPARATLHQLAAMTGGTERYAVAADDLGALARAVLDDVASPPAPLAINWGTLGTFDVEPAVLARLGGGQAMLVVARVKRAQPANARTRGDVFAFEPLGRPRPVDGATTASGPLARRWARERLDSLVAAGDRAAVTRHALAFGLVSPYTSLVAVGSEVVVQGGVKHSVAVPVSIPSGMRWQAVKQLIDPDAARKDTSGRDTAARDTAADDSDDGDDGDDGDKKPAKKGVKKPPSARPPTEIPVDRSPGTRNRKDGAPMPGENPYTTTPPAATPAAPPASPKDVAAAEPERPLSDEELAKLAEQDAKTEVVTVTGSLIGRREEHVPGVWLGASLGGGVAVDHGARSLLSLDVRLDIPRSQIFGVEGSLWLVGTNRIEGRGLFTFTTDRVARWLDLGLGAGVHVGDGTGIAGSVRLRAITPLRWLGAVLRYDTAVLLTRPSVDVEHAATLGIELSY
jgi:vault protein inter-alpha-trypsin-like protein